MRVSKLYLEHILNNVSMMHGFTRRGLAALFSFVFLFAASAAFAKGTAGAIYVIESGEVVSGNVYRAAEIIDVQGTVQGDLIVAAETVRVSGIVEGDVIAVASTIEIEGTVKGDLRAAAQNVLFSSIGAVVEKNVTVFGKNLNVLGTVGGSVLAAGDNISVANVGKDLRAYGRYIGLQGAVGGDVVVDAEEAEDRGVIQLLDGAIVAGDFEYSGPQPQIDDGATIAGTVTQRVVTRPSGQNMGLFGAAVWFFTFFKTVSAAGMILVALVLIALFGERVRAIITEHNKQLWWNFAVGLATLIVTPIVMVLLAVTLVGLPLAFIGGALYVIKIYLAKVLYGVALGHWLMSRGVKDEKKKPNLYVAAVVGIIVLSLISLVPFFGTLIVFSGIVWMLGAGMSVVAGMLKRS